MKGRLDYIKSNIDPLDFKFMEDVEVSTTERRSTEETKFLNVFFCVVFSS